MLIKEPTTDTIYRIDLLSEEKCQNVRSIVYELQEFWLERSPYLPFYTLGAASYIDAAQNQQAYYSKAKIYNSILYKHLGWLYEQLAEVLEKFLEAPTTYQHELALPGFHIYLACKLFEQPLASIHSDLQHQLLRWESPDQTDFTHPISFTLAISLPKFGGGLNMWELKYQELKGIKIGEIKEIFKSKNKRFYPYQIGQLILHSGYKFHQAAPAKNIQQNDERITLQGHAIFSQASWHIYW